MSSLVETAPAKINLCLFLGPVRADGRHELVTLFESVDLLDRLTIEPARSDAVECPGVRGPNLVADALAGLREAGWRAPPILVRIDKAIPVAAGLGGGSADAAALLRAAPRLAPIGAGAVATLAARLGADVPSQLEPGVAVGTGAGERLVPVAPLAPHAVLVLPLPAALSTAAVYAEADRLSLARSEPELSRRHAELEAVLRDHPAGPLPDELALNDLAPAAVSLCPEIAPALDVARAAGARPALVCGSGPTVIGLFWGEDGGARAAAAAAELSRERFPGAVAVSPSSRSFGTMEPGP